MERERLLKWNESYNCYSCRLAPSVKLSINWDSTRPKKTEGPMWKAYSMGKCLGNYATFEEAELAVIKFAETQLETAINKVVDALMKHAESVSEETRG